jgi:hypothetical protein
MRSRVLALPSARRNTVFLLVTALAIALLLWSVAVMPATAKTTTVRLSGVQTLLYTNPATTTLLFNAGIIPLPVAPTPVVPTADAARYTFPITGGMVDGQTLAGSIQHSGGILLAERTKANGWKSLSLTKFTIVVAKHSMLTAIVNGGSRAAIATLDLGKAKITRFMSHGHTFVRVSYVGVSLNATAVGAINSTFGTHLTAPVKFGTARVLARVVP